MGMPRVQLLIFASCLWTGISGESVCSNHCDVTSKTPDCWVSSWNYFRSEASHNLDNYAKVFLGLLDYEKRHKQQAHSSNLPSQNLTEEELSGEIEKWNADSPTKPILLSADVAEIVKILLTRIYNVSTTTKVPPEFHCPEPPEYQQQLWKYIAIASILLNVGLALLVFPFIVRTEVAARTYKKAFNEIMAMQSSIQMKRVDSRGVVDANRNNSDPTG